MVREHRPCSHKMGLQYALMCERREAGVAVNEMDAFAEDDSAEVGKEGEEVGEGGGGGDDGERDVVHLERGQQVAHSDAVWRMAVGYDDHLMRGWLMWRRGRGGEVGGNGMRSSGW